MFTKPISELVISDIEALLGIEPEGSVLEYKEALTAKTGLDPWYEGKEMGERAKKKLVKEIVAFANAHGGTLLIGIKETDTKPPIAEEIKPVPRCHDLAVRINQMLPSVIEPRLPTVEVGAVETDEEGGGVIVIRAPQSRLAPHRETYERQAYYRRGGDSVPMTMREIQDLTLTSHRGLEAINKRFQERHGKAGKEIALHNNLPEGWHSLRATLFPVGGELYIDKVHGNPSVAPTTKKVMGRFETSGEIKELYGPYVLDSPRPLLRATRSSPYDRPGSYLEVHCDGLIEHAYSFRRPEEAQHDFYHPGWFVGVIANAIAMAHRFRLACGAPEIEYGLEVELEIAGTKPLPVSGYFRSYFYDSYGELPPRSTIFPRYSIGPVEEWGELMPIIERDFWHLAGHGKDDEGEIEIDFSTLLT